MIVPLKQGLKLALNAWDIQLTESVEMIVPLKQGLKLD